MASDQIEKSYAAHAETYSKHASDEEVERYAHWFENKTVDLWRHERMFNHTQPFLKHESNATWLTIADGRFGTAARYLESNGAQVVASDIDSRLLQIAQNKGWITEFRNENAEAISFNSESFDFLYCKESYHHFPRPFMAVYEMLRVARKAIIFTEPAEFRPLPPIGEMLRYIKNRFRSHSIHADEGMYEEIGNYIYTISEREFEKVALALNLPAVAFLRFHDSYSEGCEDEQYSENGPHRKIIEKQISKAQIFAALGLMRLNHITAVIFKELPSTELTVALRQVGFDVRILPRNPILK
ncbi:MAG: class I SAM-dependent methyltransferase [Flavobacteriales bacterium]